MEPHQFHKSSRLESDVPAIVNQTPKLRTSGGNRCITQCIDVGTTPLSQPLYTISGQFYYRFLGILDHRQKEASIPFPRSSRYPSQIHFTRGFTLNKLTYIKASFSIEHTGMLIRCHMLLLHVTILLQRS